MTTASLTEKFVTATVPIRGVLMPLPCLFGIDLAAKHGYDFVVIDVEHGPFDERELQHHFALAQARGIVALVRLHQGDLAIASRLLDSGCSGFMLSRISSAKQAREAAQLSKYPPHGNRGFALGSPAGRYGTLTTAELLAAAERSLFNIAMIEDAAGVSAATEIARVNGISALFLGSADLKLNSPEIGEAELTQILDQLDEVATATGTAHIVTEAQAVTGAPRMQLVNLVRLLDRGLAQASGRS